MAEYQRHDPSTEKLAMRGLGTSFSNKSLTLKHKLDLVGSLSSLDRAIEWYRKSDSQGDLTAALFLLAETKFGDAKWEEGLNHLQESLRIAMKRDDYIWIGQCLDLGGRLKFTLGDKKGALGDFSAALKLMREKGKPKEMLRYMGKVATLYVKQDLKDEARKLLNEAIDLSKQHELLEDYADTILDLAKLEDGTDADAKRQEALRTAIASLETLLLKTQVKGRRAFLMGKIGSFHQRLAKFNDAISWFTRAKDVYEEIGNVGGVANCLSSFAEIWHEQNNPDEELKTYREILSLTQGKPMPQLVASTMINMGVCLMQNRNFREAQQLFKEADEISRNHHLGNKYQDAVASNLKRVQQFINAYKPAAMDLSQLVHELHELVAFFPEAKDSLLRLWYNVRDPEIQSNCRSQMGVKFLVVENDTKRFLQLVDSFAPYADLALQAVDGDFPGSVFDVVPYPKDKTLPDKVYRLTSSETKSKTTGNIAAVICGRAYGLPPQAHQLMLGLSADELVSKKVLFFPCDRPANETRLSEDLQLGKELMFIPFYAKHLPKSDEVDVVASIELILPIIPMADRGKAERSVARIKRKLVRLLSLKEQEATTVLTEIAGDLDDLMADCGAKEGVRTTAYLLRYPVRGTIESH